jgi:prolipoprotein diacylglyceryltransferase
MIARGKITFWTLVGLAVGLWAAYRELKDTMGSKEAHEFLLYGVFGFIVVSGIISALFEWSERVDKKRRRERFSK